MRYQTFKHELASPYTAPDRPRYALQSSYADKLASLQMQCKLKGSESQDSVSHDQVIAMSVAASSSIEGEGLPSDALESFVSIDPLEDARTRLNRVWAMTEPGEHVDPELRARIESHQDIEKAYIQLLRISKYSAVTEQLIVDSHRSMFVRANPKIAGQYKTKEVKIQWHKNDGSVVSVPTVPREKVQEHMYALCDYANLRLANYELGNILVAAEFCCDFLAIHPFFDGNGRLSRMLCGMLLKKTGYYLIEHYPLEQIILETRPAYYKALNSAQSYWKREEEDMRPWVEYFLDCLIEHSRRALRQIEISSAC